MPDVLTPAQRRLCMSRIRSRDTKPELVVRSLVHRMGYRFRLHRKDLPGKPDLVFPKLCKVPFVHGCFWHMHRCRYGRVKPKTNARFWEEKRRGNVARDRRSRRALRRLGWDLLVIWECWTRNLPMLEQRVSAFLGARD